MTDPAALPALIGLIDRFAGRAALVVGDVILDEYLIGRAARLSREAPIPVVELERREVIPGGAANPAANLAALGCRVTQIGVIGADPNGETLRGLLAGRGIDPGGLVVDSGRPTITKTRIMAQMGLRYPQQVARLDRLDRSPVIGAVQAAAVSQFSSRIGAAGAALFSDYLNGLLTPETVGEMAAIGRAAGAFLAADSQGELDKYAGFDCVKCNADEAERYLGRTLHTEADFTAAAEQIAARLAVRRAIMITRGAEGITLAGPEGAAHVRAPKVEDVFDTVGAGDTVLAVAALGLLVGGSAVQAAGLAVHAAGIVIRRVGNYTPSPDELRAALAG